MASLSLPYTGTWLNVVPSLALGLHLAGPCPACRPAGPTATHRGTTPSAAAVLENA